MSSKKLIVIGGGAAGFFCAVNAARLNSNLQVTLLEKSNKLLSKVKVSGGGRCNVTHACFEINEMIRHYPRGSNFLKKAFHQFFTTDTLEWFEERGIQLKTEADGRMFPITNSSQTIIDCLLRECNKYGIEILMNSEVTGIQHTGREFQIEIPGQRKLSSDFLCVASGGYPKSSMFNWLTQTGHSIESPVPSLFTFNTPKHPITELMGVSVPTSLVKIKTTDLKQTGPLLITHWGLSGPAVLKLSAWGAREFATKNYEFEISVNWMSEYNEQNLGEKFHSLRNELRSQKLIIRNPLGLPSRLWEFLLKESGIDLSINWADLSSKFQNVLIANLVSYPMQVRGKTTFKEEFVTAGGIRLTEIDANSMMSKKQPSLFFAGEVMDVDGVTGGFNFQHAWTSGFIAAKSIASLAAID